MHAAPLCPPLSAWRSRWPAIATFFIAGSQCVVPASAQFSFQSPAEKTAPARIATPHVEAELVAHAPQGVEPGATVWAGLRIAHQPGWHTYWKNAGDSGLPTTLAWTLPPGLSAGAIDWPVPRKIPIGTLANYGYEGTVLLPVPFAVAADFQPPAGAATVTLRLHAEWLVCRKECIPEQADLALALPVHGSTAGFGAEFEAARAARPTDLPGRAQATVDGDRLTIAATALSAALRGRPLELLPETPNIVVTAATPEQAWQGAAWTARVPLDPHRSDAPATLPLVLVATGADGARTGWRIEADLQGAWPATAVPAAVSPALEAALQADAAGAATAGPPAPPPQPAPLGTWLAALAAALLGGLLLNLMPCVFPVLAVKVVGFARHGADRRAHRAAGLAYTAGVVVSFVLLGAVVLGLRAAGAQLGWGFQLQSPAVVAAMAVLFTLLGLNLAGVFEFGMWAPRGLAGTALRHPVADAFLSGVLAVAIASPCTAPFMGASLGLALGLPAAQALPLFAVLGLGMALPYLAASWLPAVARLLPRPGAWMDVFRRAMAFPMFATVAWLTWVLGQQSGIDGAGTLLALLVTLAAVVWSLTLRGRARVGVALLSVAALAGVVGGWGYNLVRYAPVTTALARAGERWAPWSPARVAALQAEGRPVFVDFTAAWCVTCQVNERGTLARDDVLAAFDGKRVALLRADWTRQDPAVSAALRALSRSGVPVYLLQAPGRPPVVLTELLGVDEVKAAVAAL
ncbi:protein-disulfide reductase DsbD family protein [Xylophilus ampelinus]|uniref:Thiol:disulfide interchange protein DsbD n=1 Tax=Xylophilus ampelinus TaxID=54067 RepID=A0A318SLC7_9BURK|nr:thioredoxin family protein [Xylophilus ampelinus]MCS4510631.1 thioredoxin family protein [Xylophilus ampelinus]PYE76322.1 thiol:disulfide interchange protein DsbD [Xylophilus ampelinus]